MSSLWNSSFKPMLQHEIDKPFNSDDYIFEMKYDGIRALVYVSPKEIKIMSRNHVNITSLYPELKDLQKQVKKKVIFDGEIICLENGLPSFSKLQERSHLKDKDKITKELVSNPITFICFDILYENKDLTNLSLMKRKAILNKYKDMDYFVKPKYIDSNGIELFDFVKKIGLEGIVAKCKNSKYEINTRSYSWLKIKNFKEELFYIGGYSYKEDSHVFSVLLGEYVNNKLTYVGRVFVAKKNKLFNVLKKSRKIKSKFINNEEEEIVYINPSHKCKIKYIERTPSNHLRQPFYVE